MYLKEKSISSEDLEFFAVVDTAEDAVAHIDYF